MFLEYIWEACTGTVAARRTGPWIVTSCRTTVWPGCVSSQFPPMSAARSTRIEPGFIRCTTDAGMSRGAGTGQEQGQDRGKGLRREQHGLVAGDRAHGRERVHPLGARGAGHHVHAEARDTPLRQRLDRVDVAERTEHADQGRPLAEEIGLVLPERRVQEWWLDLEDGVGAGPEVRGSGDDRGAGFLVGA